MARGCKVGIVVIAVLTTAAEWSSVAWGQNWARPQPPPYASRRVRCESDYRHSNYCPTNAYGRVRLERRLGRTRCIEGVTWGADRDGGGVWVADGCRAIFVVTPWGGPGYGPGYPHGDYRPVLTVTCKSKHFKPNYCRLPRWGHVRLERRLSGAPCREYYTWGVDGGGIWVDNGCAAVFSVR